jgi:hypothetical protein
MTVIYDFSVDLVNLCPSPVSIATPYDLYRLLLCHVIVLYDVCPRSPLEYNILNQKPKLNTLVTGVCAGKTDETRKIVMISSRMNTQLIWLEHSNRSIAACATS